jgi:transcriptional regulator with XRE-family HTH domain
MNRKQRQRLVRMGGRLETTEGLLGLSDEEATLVRLRVLLARTLRERRAKCGWSQVELSRAMGSSQSRVAKIEAGDPGVSLDLVLRALLVHGNTVPVNILPHRKPGAWGPPKPGGRNFTAPEFKIAERGGGPRKQPRPPTPLDFCYLGPSKLLPTRFRPPPAPR